MARRNFTLLSRHTRRAAGSSANSSSSHRRARSGIFWRLVSAAIGIPAVLLLDHLGGPPFAIGIAVVGAVAGFEFYRMARLIGSRPVPLLGLPAIVAVAVLPIFVHRPQEAWIGILVAVTATTGIYFLLPFVVQSNLGGWQTTITSVVYIGVLLGHLSLLRVARHGVWWVVVALVITWAYDSGAFVGGSLVGKRPFMRHVSGSKTIEGVAGGLMLAIPAGLVAVPTIGLAVWQALALGLLGGVAAQAGDLVESMLKRQSGVKDAGVIVPGHGGILDRVDSLLFTGALAYYAALLLGYAA